MPLFSFNIFADVSFCREAFLELRFWTSVRNLFLSSYLKQNSLLVVSLRFLMLLIFVCLENFPMHAKT